MISFTTFSLTCILSDCLWTIWPRVFYEISPGFKIGIAWKHATVAGHAINLKTLCCVYADTFSTMIRFLNIEKRCVFVVFTLKVRLNTTINQADFVSWCMLYIYEDNN